MAAIGPKEDKEHKAKTIESLFETQNRIAGLLSYLGATNIAVANFDGNVDKEHELVRQAAAKLGFFQSFAESLEKAFNDKNDSIGSSMTNDGGGGDGAYSEAQSAMLELLDQSC